MKTQRARFFLPAVLILLVFCLPSLSTIPANSEMPAAGLMSQPVGRINPAHGNLDTKAPLTGTWSPLTSGTTNHLFSVHFVNASEGWAAGFANTILHTTDGGGTWAPQTNQSGVTVSSYLGVRFLDSNIGWAGGASEVVRTTDGGASWTGQGATQDGRFRNNLFAVSSTAAWIPARNSTSTLRWFSRFTVGVGEENFNVIGSSSEYFDIYFTDVDNGWSVGTGPIVHITNGSSASPSFSFQTSCPCPTLNGIHMLDTITGWAVGNGGLILKTTDGGSTWPAQTSGTTTNLRSVHFVDANTGWAVGGGGLILVSTDGGVSWAAETSGVTADLRRVFFVNANTGYAVGHSGTILKRVNASTPGSLQFAVTNTDNTETNAGAHTVDFAVTRTGGSDGAIAVDYSVTNGTATTADNDYSISSATGTLNWADGDTANKNITITVNGDMVFEADETVNLTLSAPTGGATLGSPNPATLTITNDDPAPGTWLTVGSLATGRHRHTATLLQNGKVLVAGGYNPTFGFGDLASAELYDSATGTWSVTGSMNQGRSYLTATLLRDGRVLVAGGYNGGTLNSAEIYDPATGAWTSTGSMNVARFTHTLTLLSNGKVLATGGNAHISTAELYDPATGMWSLTGSMSVGRDDHVAVLLSNGKVLVAGTGGGNSIVTTELYDPNTGMWTNTGDLNVDRHQPAATLLANGLVLAVGGYKDGAGGLTSAELYDPNTGQWTYTGSMVTSRKHPVTVLLPSGKVLVASGQGPTTQVELYDPNSGTWSLTSSLNALRENPTATLLPDGSVLVAAGAYTTALTSAEVYRPTGGSWSGTGGLANSRYGHTATLLPDGTVLAAGGGAGGGTVAAAERYNPGTGTWSSAGNLNTASLNHSATLLTNGKVLIAGGYDNSNTDYARAELFDPTAGTWTLTGSLNQARDAHGAVLLPNGKVLVAGGGDCCGNFFYSSAELYDPMTGLWTATGSMSAGRRFVTLTLLHNGKVLAAGGQGLNTAEIYDPQTGLWTATGNMNVVHQQHSATLLPNGKVLVAGSNGGVDTAELFDPSTGTWTPTGSMNQGRYSHMAVLLPDGRLVVAGGFAPGGPLTSAEVYDPISGQWTSTPAMSGFRELGAATILLDGKVLVVGGSFSGDSAELFDTGAGFISAWQPILSTATSPLGAGQALVATGSMFQGVSEAAAGHSQDSATNYPLVQLRSLVNEQMMFVPLDSAAGWTGTSFTSLPVNNFPPGHALATVLTNAIPSISRIVLVSVPPAAPTLGNYPDTSVQLSGNTTVTPDAAPTNTTSIHVSTSTNFKGKLEGDPTTGVVRVTDAHPAGLYTVTVTAFGNGGLTATKTFALTVTTPATCNPVSFAAAASFGVGANPESVAVGDFNGDGKQDLAVANLSSENVSVLLGDGSGSFSAATNFGVGSSPSSVAVGDFNGDSKQDLAVANFSSNNVSILLGDGAGSFSAATNFGVGVEPRSVAVGDFNGDGKQDLAVANHSSENVSVLLGDGAGGFSAATNFGVGSSPSSVAVGEFNGDGKQDLAVANISSNNVSILLGNGAGSFSAATNFGVGTNPRSVAVGDFNGDSKQDLAVANISSNNVSTLLGNGAGSFSAATNFGVGSFPQSVAVGDFNGDGKQDLAVANHGPNNVSILLGDGAGSFSAATNFGVGTNPHSVAVGDFNGDGKQDLATANINSSNVSVLLRQCQPTLSINSTSTQTEGDSGQANMTFMVTLSSSSSQLVTVNYSTANGSVNPALGGGSCGGTVDYLTTSGTLTFNPGDTTKTIDVPICGDTTDEPDETFTVTLDTPANATIASGAGTGTITDDDSMPTISIGDFTFNEGNAGTTAFNFLVTLSNASAGTVTVDFTTQNGTATEPGDYTLNTGTRTFVPGDTQETITVLVNGDTTFELNETFFVNLSNNSTNSIIQAGTGMGTITNEDVPPTTLVVNTTNDVDDGICDATHCSLREAINAANFSGDASTINFNIPNTDPGFAGGVFTIQPTPTALPALAQRVTIDGTSQAAFGGDTNVNGPEVVLNGSLLTGLPNGFILSASNIIIKGLVINGFGAAMGGVASNYQILDNYIGTNAAGTAAVPNTSGGLGLGAGSGNLVSGNLISGNGSYGISACDVQNSTFSNNKIGTDRTGVNNVGNGGVGFQTACISFAGNTISGNTIAFNGSDGFRDVPDYFGGVPGHNHPNNRITQNSIYSNGGLGINLLPPPDGNIDGVTPNDPQDPDEGGNHLQNFPVITSAIVTGSTRKITGTLNTTPNSTSGYTIEFFSNPDCDASGNGEGKTYLGSVTTGNTDANGDVSFTFNSPTAFTAGDVITATATDASGNTSEFSACSTAVAGTSGTIELTSAIYSVGESGGPAQITVTRAGGSDGSISATFTTSDGSATAGSDYTDSDQTVTFVDGQAGSQTINIPINNDANYEANETVNLSLSATTVNLPSGGGKMAPSSPTVLAATLTITNDDAPPTTLVVNTTNDLDDGICDSAHCSLREAIIAANFSGDASTINFNIPNTDPGFTGGVFTIQPTPTALPALAQRVTIDGTSQAAFGGDTNVNGPEVVLNGSLLTGLPNGFILSASNIIIKGLVINGFGAAMGGVASNYQILDNYIGTNAAGTAAVPNTSGGLGLGAGSGNLVSGNLISGNGSYGISACDVQNSTFSNNKIGTDRTGVNNVGNGGVGFQTACISFAGNTISGNTIAFNGSDGFRDVPDYFGGVPGHNHPNNRITQNSIYSNGGLGINLLPPPDGNIDGVTPNDPQDTDEGGNHLQNFPVLTSAGSSSGTTTITGSLNSTANTTFTLEFYASTACDSSGNGEGETYIGSTNVTTDGSGDTSFVVSFPASIPAGQVITATATDPAGNTSEFSACSLVSAGLMIPAGSYSTVTIANGTTVTLTGDVTITGQLTLNGDLDTGGFTLTMPAGAMTTGNGDVIGNVRRTGFVIGTALSFGNPFNTIRFDSGTPPTEVTMNLVKSAPVSFPNAVERTYTITPVGGSGYSATLQLHYVDTELNGNSEATLEFWRHNGTVWGGQGVATRDATDNWVNLTGVTEFSPWVIAGPGGPTAIELASFTATGYDNGVFIEWKTGLETDNLGFNIYRDADGKRALVNSQLIAGSALKDGASLRAGESYAWWDGGIADCELRIADCKNASYWLEDVDLKGASTWHGPFGAKRVAGTPPPRSNAALLSKLGSNQSHADSTRTVESTGSAQQASPTQRGVQSDLASQQAVKISVRREGWYRVTQPELVAAGLNPKIDPRFLQLFVDGREVPIYVSTGKDGAFDESSTIEFYGQGLDTPSTDGRIYWLIVSAQDGKRIGRFKSTGEASSARSFTQTVERKDRTIYFSALRNGDKENFFGAVVAGAGVDQTVGLTHLAQFDTGNFETTLEVALQGVTLTSHRVLVQLNGVGVREIIFNGQDQGVARFNIDQSLLREGENTVRLVPQNGASDISVIDHIRFSYQHSFAADNDALKFTANSGQQVAIEGFSSGAIRVFDVTDASSPQELTGDVSQSKTGFSLTVAPREPGLRTLIALTDEKAKPAASIQSNNPSSWRNPANAADLVIFTVADLFSAIEPLKLARQAEGYKVALINVADIYDEFNFGHKSPQAIRDLLSYANANWKLAPRFVLFAGDASFDGRNYLGLGDNDLVPTKLIDTAFMETATDDWFADFNNDGVSDLAVGRLPLRSVEEAATVVSKLLRYSQSKPGESVALVSDANDGFNFEQASTQLRALLPSILKVDEIKRGELDPATAKVRLVEAINRGQKLVNYTGHGSANQWRGDLLSSADARAMTNQDRLPVFVMMTCLNGFFHDAALDSLAESLIKAERGGAVAVWASSGMTFPDQQALINRQFYRQLFGGSLSGKGATAPTLGEATMRAKSAVADPDIRRTWVLFGDPTMRLR